MGGKIMDLDPVVGGVKIPKWWKFPIPTNRDNEIIFYTPRALLCCLERFHFRREEEVEDVIADLQDPKIW